jgi:hypothetical protein
VVAPRATPRRMECVAPASSLGHQMAGRRLAHTSAVCHHDHGSWSAGQPDACVMVIRGEDNVQSKRARRLATSGPSNYSRQRPTLPQPCGCSTIGGSRLNFRVRNGNGCGPAPVTTGKPSGRLAAGRYSALDLDAGGRRGSMVGAICSARGLPGNETIRPCMASRRNAVKELN